MRIVRGVLLGAVLASTLGAQSKKLPIADNSFLMEEAYNQEAGVIQHISLFQKPTKGSGWMYAFTEEWPVKGQKNQFSFTLPFSHAGNTTGFGDAMLNWRFQVVGKDDEPTWFSPRISLVLPTGDKNKGFGTGSLGFQGALPLSHRWNDELVSHSNLGLTLTPGMKVGGADASSSVVSLGQSFIYQPMDRLNFMVEAIWTNSETKIGSVTFSSHTSYISPGLRWGYDFPSGLQVVPGIAFPIGVGDSKDDNQVLLYLSFEHPVKKP